MESSKPRAEWDMEHSRQTLGALTRVLLAITDLLVMVVQRDVGGYGGGNI